MVNLNEVSLCLITKEKEYPQEILSSLPKFGEILIKTKSDSPYRKYALFKKAKYDLLAYQDDDAICPWEEIIERSDPAMINVAMKEGHFESYKPLRMTMGLGWGSIFPKHLLDSLKKYTDIYDKDDIFKRETERILTYLNYPQNRMVLPIEDLPSAMASDRLWRQPQHYNNIQIVQDRCKELI